MKAHAAECVLEIVHCAFFSNASQTCACMQESITMLTHALHQHSTHIALIQDEAFEYDQDMCMHARMNDNAITRNTPTQYTRRFDPR